MPATTEIEFKLERDVDKVMGNHLDNMNRIFRDLKLNCRFKSKADVFPTKLPDESTSIPQHPVKFIGVPDFVLCDGANVLSFIEDKTPVDLPVTDSNNCLIDLLEKYREDLLRQTSLPTHKVDRKEVIHVIEQVYGYIALNNLIYGCVTCYDVTYFLWRNSRGTLFISHPIYNNSTNPTLLQSIYYYVQLVLAGNQTLDPSPTDVYISVDVTDFDSETNEGDDKYENKPSTSRGNNRNQKNAKFDINMDSLRDGFVIGSGATGQVIHLKDQNTVLKHCDTYNNHWGSKMMQNEITIYEKLSKLNLNCIPKYYGDCDLYGLHCYGVY